MENLCIYNTSDSGSFHGQGHHVIQLHLCMNRRFYSFWIMFINIRKKFMYIQHMGSFHDQGHYIIQWNFSLAWLTKLIVYLKICWWILKQLFHLTEILLFALIPRYIAKMSQGQWRYDFVLVQLQSCIGL